MLYNKPVNTRDTAVRVHGVSRCAKIDYRTRTCDTRFGSTAGKPVPVQNPKDITDHTIRLYEERKCQSNDSSIKFAQKSVEVCKKLLNGLFDEVDVAIHCLS